jgi:hypothetical protein
MLGKQLKFFFLFSPFTFTTTTSLVILMCSIREEEKKKKKKTPCVGSEERKNRLMERVSLREDRRKEILKTQ